MEVGGSSTQSTNAPMNVGAVVPSKDEIPNSKFQIPNNSQTIQPSNGQGVSEADAGDGLGDEELELPEFTDAQIAFVESERYQESAKTVGREFGLGEEDLVFLGEMDRAVLGGLITLPQYAEALRGEFANLNAAEKDRLIGFLFAVRFAPFGTDLKPSAEEAARMLRIALPPMPYYRVYTKPLTFSGAAHEVALMAGIPLMRQAQERIRDIFMSRLSGVRSDTQTEEQLTRAPEVGGVGAKPEAAKAALAAMDDIAARAELLSEEEYAAWLNRSLHPPAPAAPTPAPAEETEEEKEIREIAARMPRAKPEQATILSSSINAILARLSWKPNDPYLDRRLADMVSTRLRDVRSRNECFMKLMRDTKVGGLGLDRKTAEGLVGEIEQGYAEFHGQIAAEEKTKLDAQMLEQERKIEERKRRDAEERQRWYEEKVSSKQRTEEAEKSALERLKTAARGFNAPAPPAPMAPVEAKDRARERAAFGELVPAPKPRIVGATSPVRPSGPPRGLIRPNPPTRQPAPPPTRQPTPPPARESPHPPVVKVSPKTVEIRKSAENRRPKLDDIAPMTGAVPAHLAGPLEQIGGMTLAQFRRLASPPSAAAHRIEELVGLLAQESFERRVSGVQAWQRSPLQALYLKLVTEAFRSGKPVKALAEAKRTAGEDTLTAEELDAIIALNGVLRIDH